MRERQEGRYYGIGIQIQAIDGDITAMRVFEGSPANRAGMRRGDAIATIGGEPAKGWTTEQAMNKLRGAKGTPVRIEIRRRGYEEPIPIELSRDEVHILTVPASFMIDGTTGYILMQDFGENTEREVRDALRDAHVEGHEAAGVRYPRQPRRSARPGDQGLEPVPAPRQDDCLHARAASRIPTRTIAAPTTARIRKSRSSSWSTGTAPARRRLSPERSRITTAATSSARPRSARRWCSRSTALPETPAWR